MAKAGYSASTGAAVATGAALKTILTVLAPAQFGVDLKKIHFGFDGVTASAVPVLCELWLFTTDGTATGGTVQRVYGPTITAGFTSKYNYTVEPTGLTGPLDSWDLTPNGGTVLYDWPLGDTPDTAVSNGFALRTTSAATVGCRATMWFERT
jgi:hypothetical protein